MASKIKGINIKIGADTKGLDTALQSIDNTAKKTGAELKEVNRTISKAPESITLWQQKQELLTKAVEESRAKVKLLEDAQEDVAKQLADKKITGEQYRAFQRELEAARAETDKFENQLSDTNEKISDLKKNLNNAADGAEETGDSFDSTADSAEKMGNEMSDAGDKSKDSAEGFTVLKGTLANLAAEGIKKVVDSLKEYSEQAMELEDSTAKLSTIADGSVTIEKMSEDIIELSNATGISAKELTDTAYDAISAGQSTADAVGFVGEATNLARAGFADTASTLDLLTTILNSYGLESEKVSEVSDVLIQTQNLGKTTVAQLSSAMGKVIPTANACGVSLDQLAAGYAVMTSKGVATAETTTYLNSMLNELSKSGTKSSDILKEQTGKSFQELVADGESLSEILSHVKDAADRQNLSFNDMWGSAEAGKAGLILLGESAEDYNIVLDQMRSSSGATETALEKLDTKSYQLEKAQNQLKNTIIAIGSDTLKAITPLAEKFLPKIESGLEIFVEELPEIEEKGKKLLPVIVSIGSAWAMWKTSTTVVEGVTSAINAAKGATQLLNSTLLANPWTALATVIVAATAALVTWKLTQEDELTVAEKVAEQYADTHEAIYNTGVEISKLNGNFKDSAEKIDFESQHVESLWKELDNLADASGRVKDADKKRAEYILGELNEALGTEYSMTGNQIGKYQELSQEIDNVIAKKKAEAYLDEYLAMSSEMAKHKADSLKDYQEAYSSQRAAETRQVTAQKNFNAVYQGDMTAQQISEMSDEGRRRIGVSDDIYNAAVELDTANQEYVNATAAMHTSKSNYREAEAYFTKLTEAETAFAEQRYDDVEKIIYAHEDVNKAILESTDSTAEEIEEAYTTAVNNTVAQCKIAIDSTSQSAVNEAFEAMGKTVEFGQQAGKKSSELFTAEMKAEVQKALDEGYDISELAKWGKTSGIDIAEVFGEDYTEVIQDQLDKGYDITDLLKWGYESGDDVAKKYSDEYYKLVQDRLDQGYDITALLQWGSTAGFDISVLFTDEFTRKFQSTIDLGFDTGGLIDWAVRNGIDIGDLFGENFKDRVTQYLYDVNDLIPHNINSQWDADLHSQGRYATGGYISAGNMGIVAESGPELIEAMNGGIRITPLTDNAQNTPVSTVGGQKVFYNTYNINNPRISSNMDIRKIAQELASEQRRIERGRGL